MVLTKRAFCILTVLLLCSPVFAQNSIEAITNPSADVTISFVQPGRISKVHFKEGDFVKAGQLLIQQDDAVALAQMEQIEAESKNTTQIEAGKASFEQKKVDLEKLNWAAQRGAATELEVAHAKLEAKIAELSLDIAKFEHEQSKRKFKETKIRVAQMSLKTPLNGVIEKIDVEVGESINGLADVIRIVNIDPLWIDVHVPLTQASNLKGNQIAKVAFSGSDNVVLDGKITFVAAVADAASSTLRIRIEVPNETNRTAGEHVQITLPGTLN
jgi:RND family efflux transporter MFP subunit